MMKQILTSALYLLTIFVVSTFIFEPTHLYYELKWLDIPMHVMGGFGVASLASAVFAYFGKPASFWKLFVVYSIVAIGWEFYEYANDIVNYSLWGGWVDTTSDYINGLIGMLIAYFLVRS